MALTSRVVNTPAVGGRAVPRSLAVARDLLELTKPAVTAQVVVTAAGGMWLAPDPVSWGPGIAVAAGTAAIVGAANAFNCYIERDSDRLMERTRNRPLPAGRLAPMSAIKLGIILTAISLPLLVWGGGALTTVLGLVALLIYVGAYTPLKRLSSWSLPIGAIPGAVPPLMGWAAATGSLELGAWALFAVLYLWQFPHFIAIGVRRRREYDAAGLVTLTTAHGVPRTVALGTATAILLAVAGAVIWPLGLVGSLYGTTACVMGVWLIARSWPGRSKPEAWARRLFFGSLTYLLVLFLVLPLDVLLLR